MQDTPQYYGTISRLLHWLMAAAFAFMLFTAIMWNINEDYFSLMGYHKSVGTILAVLIVLRVVWSAINASRRPFSAPVVKLGHAALYLLMIAVPFIGLIRQYGAARGPLNVFGIEVMTGSPEKIEWMVNLGNAAHGKLAFLLFFLAAGHIVMAVIHQLRGEKIINRMIGPRR